MTRASAIVPAAGKGARFAASHPDVSTPAKIFADLNGVSMLDRTVQSLLTAGLDDVIVVLSEEQMARARVFVTSLADPRVRIVMNPDPSRGMFSSIQAGASHALGEPLLILPADMPFVLPATIRSLLIEYSSDPAIISPRFQDHRGHPIVLPPVMRDILAIADTAGNLHDVLDHSGVPRRSVDVSDRGILRDVDVVSDLQA